MADVIKEPSLGQLFSELAHETGTLVRQEVQLAKAEITQKASSAGHEVAFIAAGGALALAGLLVLLAALVSGLSTVLPVWASALLVGLVVVGLGASLVMKGMNALKHLDPTPKRTVRSLQRTKEWAKEQVT